MRKNRNRKKQLQLFNVDFAGEGDALQKNQSSSATIVPITSPTDSGQFSSPSHLDSPGKLIKVRPLEISEQEGDEEDMPKHRRGSDDQQKKQTIQTNYSSTKANNFMQLKKTEEQKNQTVKTEHFVYESDESYEEEHDDEEIDEVDEDEEEDRSSQEEQKKQKLVLKEKIFMAESFQHLIFSPIPPSCTLKCILLFEEDFFSLTREYELFLVKEKKKIITAERSRLQIKSQFHLSNSKKQNVGKIKANFTGTEFIMQVGKEEKQICWIGYNLNILGFGGQRNMTVLRNPNKKLQNVPHFSRIKTYYENGLSTKFQRFQNKRAVQKNGKLQLDFHGKVALPSNRNFILVDQTQKECLLFGKKEYGVYILEISHPFSIAQAFGIAMSALDRKILVR